MIYSLGSRSTPISPIICHLIMIIVCYLYVLQLQHICLHILYFLYFRRAFLTNTECASSAQILKCLNKCFHHSGLWIPKDNRLDPALPLLFQSLIKVDMSSDVEKKQYYPVMVSHLIFYMSFAL
jgi:hypothetical protein